MTTMTDAELNAALAGALGLSVTSGTHNGAPVAMERDESGVLIRSFLFSPATSSDDLREYVLPEVESRGLALDFCHAMHEEYDVMCLDHYDAMWSAFTADTKSIALAALRVLGGGE